MIILRNCEIFLNLQMLWSYVDLVSTAVQAVSALSPSKSAMTCRTVMTTPTKTTAVRLICSIVIEIVISGASIGVEPQHLEMSVYTDIHTYCIMSKDNMLCYMLCYMVICKAPLTGG